MSGFQTVDGVIHNTENGFKDVPSSAYHGTMFLKVEKTMVSDCFSGRLYIEGDNT